MFGLIVYNRCNTGCAHIMYRTLTYICVLYFYSNTGDIEVGKSSFMRRYVCDTFQFSSYGYYNNSPGSVLFLEKQISMKQINLYLGLWCSTTYSIYESALNIICQEANIIIFMFSLVNKSSINSIKSWYEQAQSVNKKFIPLLVGTKYDIVQENIDPTNPLSRHYLNEYYKITRIARKYAMKMNSSLIYISSKDNININHVIKTCVAKVFNIKPKLKEYHWDTLRALREHNVCKLLKCWSSHKKMKYLIAGYLKQEGLYPLIMNFKNTENINRHNVIEEIIKFCQYNLKPSSSKKKTHRKKNSSRISTKSRDSEKRSSERRTSRRTSRNSTASKSDKKKGKSRSKRSSRKKDKNSGSIMEIDRSKKGSRRKSSKYKYKKSRKPSKISRSSDTNTIPENLINHTSTNTGTPSLLVPTNSNGSPSLQLPVGDCGSVPKLEELAQSSNASSFMSYEGYDMVVEGADPPI